MRKFNLRKLIVWAVASFSLSASPAKASASEVSKRVFKFQSEISNPENANSKIAKYFSEFHKSSLDKNSAILGNENELEAQANFENWNNWDMWNNWDSWNNWDMWDMWSNWDMWDMWNNWDSWNNWNLYN